MQAPDYSSGIRVALLVPEEVGARLAIPGGLAADDLHITLAYLGTVPTTGDDPERLLTLLTAVRDGSADHTPVTGRYNGVCRFSGDGQDALVLTYDSPDIASLRADIVEALKHASVEVNAEHGFVPHTTLAYLQPKEEAPLARIEPTEVGFDRVHLVYGETAIPLPLTGPSHEEGEPVAGSLHAYPSTTSPTVNAETKDAAFEALHPRKGGKFTNKDKPAQGELPPDWLERVLEGDPRFVKPKTGGGGKGGKGKKTGDAARRAARRRIAKAQRDRELSAEMDRRDVFDAALERADEAEQRRRDRVAEQIKTEDDPERKAEREAAERDARRRYETAERSVRSAERARRRAFERTRRRKRLTQDATTAQAPDRKAG